MKAKDTVMSDDEIRKLFGNLNVIFQSSATTANKSAVIKTLVNRWVSYKAEISFKAGEQQGMKEVAEAVKSMGFTYLGEWFPYEDFEDKWQAFLKEKGIEK